MRVEKPRQLQREGSSFQALVLGQWYKTGAAAQEGCSEGQTWFKYDPALEHMERIHKSSSLSQNCEWVEVKP